VSEVMLNVGELRELSLPSGGGLEVFDALMEAPVDSEKLPWDTGQMDVLYGKAHQYNLAVLEENAGRLRSYFGDCGDPVLVGYAQALAEVYSYVAAECYDNNPANGFGAAGDPVGMFTEVGLLSSISLATGKQAESFAEMLEAGLYSYKKIYEASGGDVQKVIGIYIDIASDRLA
jgi:hypothetical protein